MADVIVLGGKAPTKELLIKLDDSLSMMKCGVNTLDQLAALFRAISDRIESKADDFNSIDRDNIRSLAQMGKYVAEDMANGLGCARDDAMEVLRVPA